MKQIFFNAAHFLLNSMPEKRCWNVILPSDMTHLLLEVKDTYLVKSDFDIFNQVPMLAKYKVFLLNDSDLYVSFYFRTED